MILARLRAIWRLPERLDRLEAQMDRLDEALREVEGVLAEDIADLGDLDDLQRQLDNLRAFTAPLTHSHPGAAPGV